MATRVNSLSAIEAEHVGEGEAEEDDWERDIPWHRGESPEAMMSASPESSAIRPPMGRTHTSSSVSSLASPMTTQPQQNYSNTQAQVSASGGANVRRHQSLTYGQHSNATGGAKLTRNVTATGGRRRANGGEAGALALGVEPPVPRPADPSWAHNEDDEASVPSSPIMRAIGWGSGQQHTPTSASGGGEWNGRELDAVTSALGALEMQNSNSHPPLGRGPSNSFSSGTIGRPAAGSMSSPSVPSTPPPLRYPPSASNNGRGGGPGSSYFPPPSSFNNLARGPPSASSGYGRRASSPGISPGGAGLPPPPAPDRRDSSSTVGYAGTVTAPSRANSLPGWETTAPAPKPLGRPRGDSSTSATGGNGNNNGFAPQTPSSENPSSTTSSAGGYPQYYGNAGGLNGAFDASAGLGVNGAYAMGFYAGYPQQQQQYQQQYSPQPPQQPYLPTPTSAQGRPFDRLTSNGVASPGSDDRDQQQLGGTPNINVQTGVSSLLGDNQMRTLSAEKGYNPRAFNTRPPNVSLGRALLFLFALLMPSQARFFVIKSYTEEDVHKSLKYEIWSSTDPGNKRLDKAFRENMGRGPIYLFFSVNTRYA